MVADPARTSRSATLAFTPIMQALLSCNQTFMFAATTIADEILDLKRQRNALLLAHHYQEPEIQELADVVGDSLELARKAREFSGDVIAFCGVWFMSEIAKVLNAT